MESNKLHAIREIPPLTAISALGHFGVFPSLLFSEEDPYAS
jgi:hypothetical protein